MLWGFAAGAAILFLARLTCLWLGWPPGGHISFLRYCLSPANACPCASLAGSHIRLAMSALRQSALYMPLLAMLTMLALAGAVKLARRIPPLLRSLLYGRLARPTGFVLGVLACQMYLIRPPGTLWGILAIGHAIRQFRLAWWIFLPIAVLFVAIAVDRATGARKKDVDVDDSIWSDDPVAVEAHDVFGRVDIARTIRREVLQNSSPVIALVGSYGEGKSTVLNFAAHRLEHPNPDDFKPGIKPIVVRFNAWLPDSAGSLTASFLREMQSAISRRFFVPRISKRVRGVLRVFLSSVPHAPADVGKLLPDRSQQEELQNFRAMLERLPVPVVVLIDEIDRMNRAELEELFKLLRGFPETPNLRFVCALDVQGVADSLGSDRPEESRVRYIEKFFPVRIQLNRIESFRLFEYCDGFLNALRGEFMDKVKEQDWNELANWLRADPIAPQVLNTPRRIKSIFRSFRAGFRPVASEVNALDMFLLHAATALKPTIPEEIFASRPYFILQPSDRVRSQTGHPGMTMDDPGQRGPVYERILGSRQNPNNGLLVGLVGQMFALVQRWRDTGLLDDRSLRDLVSPGSRRIDDWFFFDAYFVGSFPRQQFSRERTLELISALISVEERDMAKARFNRDFLAALEPPARCAAFLAQVAAFLRRVQKGLPAGAREGIALAIAEASGALEFTFPPQTADSPQPASSSKAPKTGILAVNLLRMCARGDDNGIDEPGRQIVYEVIRNAKNPILAAALFLDLMIVGPSPGNLSSAGLDIASLQDAMAGRLKIDYPAGQFPGPHWNNDSDWQECCLIATASAACGKRHRVEGANRFGLTENRVGDTVGLFIRLTWRPAEFRLRPEAEIGLAGRGSGHPVMVTELLYPDLEGLREPAKQRLERGSNVLEEEKEKLQEFLEELDRRAGKASAATGK